MLASMLAMMLVMGPPVAQLDILTGGVRCNSTFRQGFADRCRLTLRRSHAATGANGSRSRRHTIETVICHHGLDMLPKTRGSSHDPPGLSQRSRRRPIGLFD